jgi:sarcosine oxidase subunit delta
VFLIPCPFCGPRDEVEFAYRGDATAERPPADAPAGAFADFVYARKNPRGWHREWWQHVGGCRQFVQVLRHTMTHEIAAAAPAGATLEFPAP